MRVTFMLDDAVLDAVRWYAHQQRRPPAAVMADLIRQGLPLAAYQKRLTVEERMASDDFSETELVEGA